MKTVVLLFTVFLFGCLAIQRQTKPTISHAERLYRANCSLCHRLHNPGLYTYQKLETYVEKYGKGLAVKEREDLLKYLKEASQK